MGVTRAAAAALKTVTRDPTARAMLQESIDRNVGAATTLAHGMNVATKHGPGVDQATYLRARATLEALKALKRDPLDSGRAINAAFKELGAALKNAKPLADAKGRPWTS